MSKELEALKEIRPECDCGAYQRRLDVIEEALEDFEWLKHKLNLTFFHSLSSPEDKMRVMKIMGVEYNEIY